MPARFLLIDGYNLLHAAGMGQQDYARGDLQRCRERLLRYLAEKLSPAEIERTLVIFDARDPPPDRPSEQLFRKLKVRFANPGGDADVVIQQWLDDHSAPKRVTLVSSDHVLQKAARRNRAEFVDSELFFEKLERRRRHAGGAGSGRNEQSDSKPADSLTAAEAAHWMAVFGDLSTIAAADLPVAEEPVASDGAADPGGEKGKLGRAKRRRGKREDSGSTKRRGRTSADDLTYWMEIFGKLPEAQELGRGKSISQADLERWLEEFDRKGD
jgi:uncharacterized protein